MPRTNPFIASLLLALAASGASLADTRGGPVNSIITIGNASVMEGNAGLVQLVFPVTIAPQLAVPGSFTINTQAGSAAAGVDFTSIVNQIVNIPTGISAAQIVVNVVPDNIVEPNETLTIQVSAPTAGITLQTDQGLGTISNDDSAQLRIAPVAVAEGNAGTTAVTLVASLSAPVQGEVRASYASDDMTAQVSDLDYDAISGTLVFPAGGAPINLTLNLRGDRKVEGNETLTLLLTSLQVPPSITAVTLAPNALVTINNDDRAVLSIAPPSVQEGNAGTTNMVFALLLDQPIQGGLTLNHQSADGNNGNPLLNATVADSDYIALTGTSPLPTGTQQAQVTLLVRGDNEVEPNQQLRLLLSNPVLAAGINPADLTFPASTIGTIVNDDSSVLSVNAVQLDEGNSGTRLATLTLALSNPAKEPVSIQFTNTDVTATAGSDYLAQSGTLTFAPGSQSQILSYTINGDSVLEATETFRVTLTDPSGNVTPAGPINVLVTIINDDSVSVRIENATTIEGSGGTTSLMFPVNLIGQSAISVRIGFATRDITALAGSDYVATSGVLEFLPGENSKSVAVLIQGDSQVERDETFAVDLAAIAPLPPSVVLDRASATGTLVNDDGDFVPVPSLSRGGLLILLGLLATLAVFAIPRKL